MISILIAPAQVSKTNHDICTRIQCVKLIPMNRCSQTQNASVLQERIPRHIHIHEPARGFPNRIPLHVHISVYMYRQVSIHIDINPHTHTRTTTHSMHHPLTEKRSKHRILFNYTYVYTYTYTYTGASAYT